jgi:hypothetical protein
MTNDISKAFRSTCFFLALTFLMCVGCAVGCDEGLLLVGEIVGRIDG